MIWLFMEFGNPSVRAFLILRWWTQMLCHIMLVLPRMSNERQRWTRSASTPRLARIKELVLPQFVCQLMGYLGRKQTFFFIVYVNFYVLNGNNPWISDGLDLSSTFICNPAGYSILCAQIAHQVEVSGYC